MKPGFVLVFLFSFVLVACGSEVRAISDDRYGNNWPLTVDAATLHCEELEEVPGLKTRPTMVWVEAKGKAYPLNGTAKTHLSSKYPARDVRDLEGIWRRNPTIPGTRISTGPLINDGLELCE